jgi:hypothetical protein
MTAITRSTDPKGRVSLPKGFANVTVIIEQINDTELRIRKARVIPENELAFPEEAERTALSDRDRDLFVALLDNPPAASEALRRAAEVYRQRGPGNRRRE